MAATSCCPALNPRPAGRCTRFAALLSLACGGMATGFAQTISATAWVDSAGNWSDTSKWSGGVLPGGNNYASFNFATDRTITINTTPVSISGLDFGSAAGAYTLTSDGTARTLTIGSSGIKTASASLQTVTGANLTLNLGSGSSIQLNGGGNLTISPAIMSVNGAQFQANGSGNLTIAPTSSLTTTGQLTLTGNGTGTINSVIGQSTSSSLSMSGHGTWTLKPSSVSTYTGQTTISAGTLSLDFNSLGNPANGVISSSSALAMQGGALSMAAKSTGGVASTQTFASTAFSFAGPNSIAAVSAGGNAATLALGAITSRSVGATVDFTLPVSGNIKTSASAATLAGWATVAGTDWATVSAGNIVVAAYATNDFSSASSNVDVRVDYTGNFGTVNSLRFNSVDHATNNNSNTSATLHLSGINVLTSGGILVTSSVGSDTAGITGGFLQGASGKDLVVMQNNPTSAFVIGSDIQDNGGATGLTKSGSGTLELSGTNTYGGPTNINGGTVTVDISSSLGSGGASNSLTMVENTTLNLNESVTVGSLFGAGTIALSSGIQLSVNGSGTYKGTIAGTGGGVTMTGTGGTLSLTGTNSYTGNTTVTSGTLSVNTLANAGANSAIGAANNGAADLVLNGGTLKYTGAAVATNRLFSVGASGGTLDASGTGALTLSNTGAMGFNDETGTRTLTLTGSGSGALAAAIGDHTGATSLAKSSSGIWTLSGTNTYTGTTTINSGTLQFATPASLYNSTTSTMNSAGSVSVLAGGTAAFNVGGPGDFTTTNINTLLASVGFQSGSRLGLDTTNASGTVAYSSAIVNPGGNTLGVTKLGPGTLSFSSTSNSYTGPTTVSAGTLQIGANNAIPSSAMLNLSGGTLALGGAFTNTLGKLQLNLNSTIDFGSAAGSLYFADSSSGVTWAPSATLSVSGYVTGSHLFFGDGTGTGLTTGQLSKITINGQSVSFGSAGELISAIPEPSTYAAWLGLGALGFAAYRRRQRRAA